MCRLYNNLCRFKLITFDVTDTLLKFRTPPGVLYAKEAAMFGLEFGVEEVTANFRSNFKRVKLAHPNFGCNGIGSHQWWKEVVFGTFRDSTSNRVNDKTLNALTEHLINKYQMAEAWQETEGALQLLNDLNYKFCIGIISNFDETLPNILQKVLTNQKFNFILTSFNAKCEKPTKRIFELALKESKIKDIQPREALHIGNSPDLDYLGAKHAGWKSVLILPETQRKILQKFPNIEHGKIFSSLSHFRTCLVHNDIKWD